MTEPTIERQLECAFADIGAQVGALIRCMVDQEIATHIARIEQLHAVLNGTACEQSPSIQQSEAPPAA